MDWLRLGAPASTSPSDGFGRINGVETLLHDDGCT